MTEMYILAIETTGPDCSVALIDENGSTSLLTAQEGMNHLQNLTPMMEKILSDRKLRLDDMTAIAASRGPGSFTGIRIGITTARAVCQALDIPAVSVPTLGSFAYAYEGSNDIIVPVLDARRDQVYAGAYAWEEGEVKEIVKGGAYMLNEFLEMLIPCAEIKAGKKKVILTGDGCVPYGKKAQDHLNENNIECVIENGRQSALYVAKLALEKYRKNETVRYGGLMPDYMRKAEAERKLEEKRKLGHA